MKFILSVLTVAFHFFFDRFRPRILCTNTIPLLVTAHRCGNEAKHFFSNHGNTVVLAYCDSCAKIEDPNIRRNCMIALTRKEYTVVNVLAE